MISVGDFRNGITLETDEQIIQVMELQHIRPGKGAAFMRTKLKNVASGGMAGRTSRPTEKFPQAGIDKVGIQYLYADGELCNFMNQETYGQVTLGQDIVGDALKFVKENEVCKICSYSGNVFSVKPPLLVELKVTETEPDFRGDTATGTDKLVVVGAGATVYVPLFVGTDGKIKIDTRTDEYLSRV